MPGQKRRVVVKQLGEDLWDANEKYYSDLDLRVKSRIGSFIPIHLERWTLGYKSALGKSVLLSIAFSARPKMDNFESRK